MSEKYDPDSAEMKELLKVNIVDEMEKVLKAVDGKLEPEIMDNLDWAIRAIQVRLTILEGNVGILQQSHLGHTNTSLTEFKNMHGFRSEMKEPSYKNPFEGVYFDCSKGKWSTEKSPVPKSEILTPEASDIVRMLKLTVELREFIREVREWELEDDYHAVQAVVELIADAADMKVVKEQ